MDPENFEDDYIQEDDFEEVIELDGNDEDVATSDNEAEMNSACDAREDLTNEDNESLEDEAIYSFENHKRSVFCCDISHDGKLAVTGGQDDRAILWDTVNLKIKFQTSCHNDSVIVAKFNKNTTMIVTGDMSGSIFVWDLQGIQLYNFELDELNWILWHPGFDNVLIAGNKEAWMWRLSQNNIQCKVFQSFDCKTTCAKIFSDGKRILMAYFDGSIRIWDLKETKVITHYKAHSYPIFSIDINSDDTLVATGSSDSTVKILNVNSQKLIGTFKIDTPNEDENDTIESLAFGAQNTLVIGSLNGFIQVWHLPTQTKRNELKLSMGVSKILIDKNNSNIFYGAGLDGVFRIFDLRTCEIIKEKTGHRKFILDFCISSDSKFVLTCSDDSTCKIFIL